jgi:hypothetical protein
MVTGYISTFAELSLILVSLRYYYSIRVKHYIMLFSIHMFLDAILSCITKCQRLPSMINLVTFFEFADSSLWEDCLCFSISVDPNRDYTGEHFVWV